MNFDLVHDIQQVYRKTVDAMSRPGLITNIKTQAEKIDMKIDCLNSTLVLALMLLDTEVTFKIISQRDEEVSKLMNQLTYARVTEAEKADFILILKDAPSVEREKALQAAGVGDLIDPHKAATIILEVDSLSNDRNLTLTGSGIAKENYVKVQPTDIWVDIRAEKNVEYPLGIDFIFTDSSGNLLCIPRTTQIAKQVVG